MTTLRGIGDPGTAICDDAVDAAEPLLFEVDVDVDVGKSCPNMSVWIWADAATEVAARATAIKQEDILNIEYLLGCKAEGSKQQPTMIPHCVVDGKPDDAESIKHERFESFLSIFTTHFLHPNSGHATLLKSLITMNIFILQPFFPKSGIS